MFQIVMLVLVGFIGVGFLVTFHRLLCAAADELFGEDVEDE